MGIVKKNIRRANLADIPRISEIYVFNNRLVYYPIFNNVEFSFKQLLVTSQIKKEFFQEVGYNRYLEDMGRDESEVQIIPLAYVRELMRGGKPQFFFLIKTPETTEKVISKYFKESFNGTDEFKNNIISQIKNPLIVT